MQISRTTKVEAVNVRIDPLGIDRLRWLKSYFEASGEKPSNSVIIRRAISFYLEHIEKTMGNEDKTVMELIRLKAHTNGDRSPWLNTPAFNGRPFSKMLRERTKLQGQRMIRRAFGIDLRKHEAVDE